MPLSVFAHDSAVVDPGADLGAGTKVWHFTHVSAGAQVGMHCTLGQCVYLAPRVRLGDGVTVCNNVSLYDGVSLGDQVFVGPGAVFTNVETPRARPRTQLRAETIRVEAGATIGANATLLGGVTVGACAFVAAGSVVTRDVAPHALVVGVPAQRRAWVCACGEKLDDSLSCPACQRSFRLDAEGRLCC